MLRVRHANIYIGTVPFMAGVASWMPQVVMVDFSFGRAKETDTYGWRHKTVA